MITYWIIANYLPIDDWYIYKADGIKYSQMDSAHVKKWEPKFIKTHPSTVAGYAQVPDTLMVIMGLPL